jgi:uncharacterized membrane protein (UPF0136 family)
VTAFALIAVGGVLLLASMSMRSFPVPKLVPFGVALLGVLTTAAGAFRL